MAENQVVNQEKSQEIKQNDKELNFRQLEQKYERQLAQERAARQEAERLAQEALTKQSMQKDDDDDDSEPYIDKRRLEKKLAKFGEQTQKQTQSEINKAVQIALSEERKQNWIKSNPDFYDVLQNAEKFAQKDPELAESILEMPEGFERQKLVYRAMKSKGYHLPEQKAPSIQDKIDANRRSPYYQPSGVGAAPYAAASDFSSHGQKQAYDKMQELKSRLRI
jgi:hypothetical protein